MTDTVNFVFGIPLVSRKIASDWSNVIFLLGNTLRSILAQSDPDFRILIAGNEQPDIPELGDPRVEFLVCPSPEKSTLTKKEMMWDKGSKKERLGKRLRQLGGGFLMLVDADDLVHRDVVSHARKSTHGCIARMGYSLDVRRSAIFDLPALTGRPFDQTCGTCAVVRFSVEDLPAPDSDWQASSDLYFYRLSFASHRKWAKVAVEHQRPLADFPFPATAYIVNHSSNWSEVDLAARPRNPLRWFAHWKRIRSARVSGQKTLDAVADFSIPPAYLRSARHS